MAGRFVRRCLLLRLGENDLAAKVWSTCVATLESSPGQKLAKDPYLMLAGDWAWSLFDRAICAHMRGDVQLSLVSVRKLALIQTQIEAEAAKRGFPHPGYNDSLRHETERPYLYFLEQLPQILADLERRAREPKGKSIVELGTTNQPNQSKRIAALIADLDLVNARQWGQPGRVALSSDPIVAALIQEGDASVEPLLGCLESDRRLTRSISFPRDFFRDRRVLPVSSAARAALQQILHAEFRGGAAEIRAYWNQNKGFKLEDRWYATLQDDRAGIGQWLQAARAIMQPDNVSGVPGSGYSSSIPLKPGEKPKLRGEILRSKSNPSVTDLLLKRATALAKEASQNDQAMGVDAIRNGLELTSILSQWDKPVTAVPPAQSLMRHSVNLWPNETTFIMSSGHDLARYIPRLTVIRAEGGDTNALSEYAVWLKSADEEKVDEYAIDAFEPLWRNPNDPRVSAVSDWLFTDPNSPWNKLPWKRSHFRDPVDSDLVKLPAFRRLLVREMEDKTPTGTMQWQTGAGINIRYDVPGSSGSFHFDWPTSEAPANDTKVDVRRCDWIAWKLSKSEQIPFFNPFATVEERDKAIQNAREVLLRSK